MGRLRKTAFKSLSSFLIAVLFVISIVVMPVEAASYRKGNFTAPTVSEITTSSARISVQLSARTYIKTCGFYLSSTNPLMSCNKDLRTCSEKVNGYLPKGQYIYYSATTNAAKITGLKNNTTYYYCFYYYDSKGTLYVSDVKTFKTAKLSGSSSKAPNVCVIPNACTNTLSGRIQNFISDTRWRDGAAWNSKTRYLSKWDSQGCCAYVADFVAYVHGYYYNPNPEYAKGFEKYTSGSRIKAGDIIHFYWDANNRYNKGGQHWIAILYKDGNRLWTAEGQMNGNVTVSSSKYTIEGNRLKAKQEDNWGNIYYEHANFDFGYHKK